MKILVIQQKMIGDVLVSSLICENLKLNYPKAEVHYLVNRFTIPVIKNHPYIDKIVVFEDEYRSDKLALYRFLKQIRHSNYDVVIDAYGKLESNLITLFSGAQTKIGWEKNYTKLLYTETVNISSESKLGLGSAIENRLNLVKSYRNSAIHSTRPQIHLTPLELESARQKLAEFSKTGGRDFLMISALGSQPEKTYPLAYMAKVLDFIADDTDALMILNYMPQQKEDITRLYDLCQPATQKQIIRNFEVGGLREFLAVTKFCKAVIGNEGGATNMAKALNVHTFSIFSPWIDKQGWNGFESENLKHVSVHLEDFKPEYFRDTKFKELKKKSDDLYLKFKAEFIIKILKPFLNTLIAG
ncbi:glycosyltransferase family 9 protein [Psychroflexus tropicus]|uniref:glycosyltransferase family 9 protein n=1 Tax=Psychroflexus tropicus TaxID=197345 RepID=UPI00036F1FF0|nr:glycosyltransferase family 9 protein [Psychroflexus tropicus]